jgi:hypothetical protein
MLHAGLLMLKQCMAAAAHLQQLMRISMCQQHQTLLLSLASGLWGPELYTACFIDGFNQLPPPTHPPSLAAQI